MGIETCPKCKTQVDVGEPWDSATCPTCGLAGFWDDVACGPVDDEWADAYSRFVWRNYPKKGAYW